MSWARDEWKNDLPVIALQNIDKLEKNLEVLKKDKQQRIFQHESLEAALIAQKRKQEDEKTKNAEFKRDLHSLTEKFDDLRRSRDKVVQDLQTKEARIGVLDGQLLRAKQAYDSELSKVNKMVQDLEKEQAEKLSMTAKLEKAAEDLNKLEQINNIQSQRQKLSSSGSTTDGKKYVIILFHLAWCDENVSNYWKTTANAGSKFYIKIFLGRPRNAFIKYAPTSNKPHPKIIFAK